MNRVQFDAFVSDVMARGYSNVRTGGGLLPLDRWRPYGVFDGGNPGIEQHIAGFQWLDDCRAADMPVTEYPGTVSGVWEFVP